ncbi:MAG: SDR family NAD(P)-dependent oxidoreductase [Pseudomonadota bacterium]
MTARWDGSLVLTGASGGLGRALAEQFATHEVTMLLLGRDAARLAAVAEAAQFRGAMVETARIDTRDRAGMARCLADFDARHPVGTVIANAGISAGTPPNGSVGGVSLEPPGTLARLVETNLIGAANTVEPLLPAMLARGSGRVVLIGSLAGLRPIPDLAGYSAAKAGLAAWGAALRPRLAAGGVSVTVVEPGFITTPMSARHLGHRPGEMSASLAAQRIHHAVGARRRLVRLPRGLAMAALIGARLPPWLGDRLLAPFAARIALETAPDATAPDQAQRSRDDAAA